MKRPILAAALVAACAHAAAQQQVTDEQARACFAARAGEVSALAAQGAYYGAWCPNEWGDWRPFYVVASFGFKAEMPPNADRLGVDELAVAYWRHNVKVRCHTPEAAGAMQALCDRAESALNHTKPLPPWVVRPNGTSATRPTYPVVGGVRGKVSNGRVQVKDGRGRPTACNYAERVVEGSSVYAQVNRTPGTVALCGRSS